MKKTQDCMAGSIHNNYIAVIRNDEEIPELWKEMARRTYPEMLYRGNKRPHGQEVLKG